MAQRTIRYGIIGFGRFAERTIAPAIRRARNSEVIALQKRSPEAARKKADECSIPLAFATAAELVAHPDVDAVFIASANSTHCPETLTAAAAGKHVIVEKPMALDAREARVMIDACREGGVRLMVGHMVRLSPVIRRVA
ncbi:MAG TPA: Gfo/Idh/MocA family oxidoreductase, partial [Bacteroidota bacterium]|nr:Gfo/Idh/MocA family oxidoreductase [Bacteroidota bacterium]